MTDDIDIEEHDVLDNPSIKNIFPDISALKKEISQFLGEVPEVKHEPIPVNTSLRHRVVFEDSGIITSSIIGHSNNRQPKNINYATSLIPHNKLKSKENPSEQEINEKEKEILHSNKIILGSKPNKISQNKKVFYKNEKFFKYQVKVLLKNIGPHLNKNRNYCKLCLILFSSQLSLNAHKKTAHSNQKIAHSTSPIKSSKTLNTNKVSNVSILKNPKLLQCNKPDNVNNIQYSNTVKSSKKPKCKICKNLFSSKGNLLRHYKNVHHRKVKIITTNSDTKNSRLTSLPNKYKDPKNTFNNTDHSCSHCQESFPNKKALIEHMYNILELKKKGTQNDTVSSIDQRQPGNTTYYKSRKTKYYDPKEKSTKLKGINKHNINKKHQTKVKDAKDQLNCNKENIKNSPKTPIINVYRCPICSYYLTATSYYLNHMIKKHKINHTSTVQRVPFDSKCKYCASKFDTIITYNKHMYKVHRPLLNEIKRHNELHKCTENKDLDTKQSSEFNLLKQSHSKDLDINDKGKSIFDSFAFKSILFKCDKCDIHFLSVSNAMNHSQHMDILINSKCKTCKRIFKKNDELWHATQHYYSDEFMVCNIREPTLANVLFKCSKCTIHLTEDSYLSHYPSCGIETPNSVYCKTCDILINYKNMESHQYCHTHKKYKSTDFTIIESAIILNDQITHNKVTSEDENMSLNTVKIKPTPVDHRRSSQNWGRKTWEELEESENLGNTLMAKSSTNRNDFEPNKSISCKAWSIFMLYMSYCNTCKSFVSNIARTRKAHKQSLCAHITKHVCKHCGLVLTNSALTTHRNLHRTRKTLKLQDYKFFDMNGKQICPPIPEYPQCDICSVHFLDKVVVKSHSCSEAEHITCDICQIKLSEAAYNLHMSFHNYKLKKRKKEKLQTLTSPTTDSIKHHETKTISPRSGLEYCMTENTCVVKNIYFTCQNCDVTVDTYVKMIDHCHSHYSTSEAETGIKKCNECSFNFEKKDYDSHQKLHLQDEWDASIVKVFNFDILYFTTENKIWVKHVFGSLPKEEIQEIVSKSIYQFEHRIKLKITQSGPIDLIVYKCDRCRIYDDPCSIFKHVENDCSRKVRKYPCTTCGLPFISAPSRTAHENIHVRRNIGLKSYSIVTFNSEEDRKFNKNVLSLRNRYILYQCRTCDGIVNKIQNGGHKDKCNKAFLCKCNECGLLIRNEDYQFHASIHNDLPNFNQECIKVILFGRKLQRNSHIDNQLMPSFSGTMLDYTFYKCFKCEICVDDKTSTERHTCLFGVAKAKCPKCPVHTPSNELHQHLQLHGSELGFVKENMTFIIFNINIANGHDFKAIDTTYETHLIGDEENSSEDKHNENPQDVHEKFNQTDVDVNKTNHTDDIMDEINDDVGEFNEGNSVIDKVVNLFRCLCGLHFMDELSGRGHSSHCNLRMKTSKQNCSKCDLLFTPSELFNHLLHHHGNRNVTHKFNIIQLCHKYDKTATLYMCSKCNLHFIKPKEVNRHFKVCGEAGNEGKICLKCNFVYDNVSFDNNHHNEECRKHYKLTVIKSSPPGFKPRDSGELINDNTHDSLKPETVKKTESKILSRDSFSKIDFRRYSNIIYNCVACNIHWLNEDSLKNHHTLCKLNKYTNHHHGVCKICGLNFSIQNIARHMYIHHEKLKLEEDDIIIEEYEDCI